MQGAQDASDAREIVSEAVVVQSFRPVAKGGDRFEFHHPLSLSLSKTPKRRQVKLMIS